MPGRQNRNTKEKYRDTEKNQKGNLVKTEFTRIYVSYTLYTPIQNVGEKEGKRLF